jgi:hypothetical protein
MQALQREISFLEVTSIRMSLDDCSTTDQTARSLSVSRLTFPDFETERSSRPSMLMLARL